MTKIALTVNGARHEADVEPRQLLVYFLRDAARAEGDERRLRHVLVRRVHGAARRRVGQVVHGARRPGRRLRGDDDRGPRRRTTSCTRVQQAFHEQHALQCGYCTPGFVMASVSLLQENPNPSEEEIRHGARGQPLPLHRVPQHRPRGPGGGEGGRVIPAAFEYERAGSVDEAIELLGRDEDAKLLAGGHSLIPLMRLRFARPSLLVDIGRLDDLRYVRDGRRPDRDRRAHAGTPTSRATRCSRSGCALISRRRPGTSAIPQVRHRGTIGGSLAHADPASDLGTILLTLDAELVARGPDGERTIPAAEFFTGPFDDRARARRRCSPRSACRRSSEGTYLKHARRAQDWATVGVAAARVDGRVQVGLTSMGATPLRARGRRGGARGRSLARGRGRARGRGNVAAERRERQPRVPRPPRAGARPARARAALIAVTAIAVLGLGEAGGRLAADLAAAGADVRGYDPDPAPTWPGSLARRMSRRQSRAPTSCSASTARPWRPRPRLRRCQRSADAVYADLNTAAPALKRELAALVGRARSPTWRCSGRCPRRGLRTPALASGAGAQAFADALGPLGMPVEVVSERAGRRGHAEAPALGLHEGPRRVGDREPRRRRGSGPRASGSRRRSHEVIGEPLLDAPARGQPQARRCGGSTRWRRRASCCRARGRAADRGRERRAPRRARRRFAVRSRTW